KWKNPPCSLRYPVTPCILYLTPPPPPPSSTLFPYTSLFRSHPSAAIGGLAQGGRGREPARSHRVGAAEGDPAPRLDVAQLPRQRSEEHTSELQSRGHLVCRLLPEKKNKRRIRPSRRSVVLPC